MLEIPPAKDTDAEDVIWGLQTAETLWKRGEKIDAVVWLRRAAQAAGDANDDDRAFELARRAAELTEWMAGSSDSPGAIPDAEPAIDVDMQELAAPSLPPSADEAPRPPPSRAPSQPTMQNAHPPVFQDEPLAASEGAPDLDEGRPSATSVPPAETVHAGMFNPWEDQATSSHPLASAPPVSPAIPPAPVTAPMPLTTLRPSRDDDEVVTSLGSQGLLAVEAARDAGQMLAAPPTVAPPVPRAPPPPTVPVASPAPSPLPAGPPRPRPSQSPRKPTAPRPPPPLPLRARAASSTTAAVVTVPPAAIVTMPPAAIVTVPPAAIVTVPPAAIATVAPAAIATVAPAAIATVAPAAIATVAPAAIVIATVPPVASSVVPVPPVASSVVPVPSSAASVVPSAFALQQQPLDLEGVEAFADLPDDARIDFAAAATIHELGEGEEIATFALAYVLSGAFDVAATMVDATAVRLKDGAVLRARGTTEEGVPMRLISTRPHGIVATWSDAAVDEAFRSIPWVEDDLRAAADRVQTLVGITIGPLGERLDASIREEIVGRLTMRSLRPAEIVVTEGEAVPGILLVGIGELELVKDDKVAGTIGSGEFLFPTEVLGAGSAPATARAGPGGALVMFGNRHLAQELLVTCPPLLEVFAGM